LLGDIEPSGRLVTTFPAADGASPAWSVTPVEGQLHYSEGTFIGYRGHYAGRAPAPAFWFGHGLGYTTWEYGTPELVADGPAARAVRVTITNTGVRAGREVVQLYFEPATADQPIRLVGWAAAMVGPGESATVEVETDRRMWRHWDSAAGGWSDLPDAGRLVVARGLGDIRGAITL